ncbi:Aste57867_1332 [Aphanomyces stellatus]|uniref:Aste57867_1332 protein n=1 Tax=Aphanomyces stellatus TaxID=120398 RepID=A0A485KAD7_9STRA|nr:hypothetical protein As57867_001331 [Aphanomyces stellatus]VFT78551.1 Aste57867_1332 [Aphanomyces stellatus]
MYCNEEPNLRALQIHSMAVLGNIFQVPSMSAVLVKDTELINAVASIAFSGLENSVIVAAIQTLRQFCLEAHHTSTLANMKLDVFNDKPMLQGVLDALDIWRASIVVAREVIKLLRQVYKFAPECNASIPYFWTVGHYAYFRDCLASSDRIIHEHLTGLMTEVINHTPCLAEKLTVGGLHVSFAELIHRCENDLLGDVLHLVQLLCKDEPTKRSIWEHKELHFQWRPTLVSMANELANEIDIDRQRKYLDFFNLILLSQIDDTQDNAYRDFVGSRTTLLFTLTECILTRKKTREYVAQLHMSMECLWRLCHEHSKNSQHATGIHAPDLRAIISKILTEKHKESFFLLSTLHCVRSLCSDAFNASSFSMMGTLQTLFSFLVALPFTGAHTESFLCATLQAISSALETSEHARKSLTEKDIAICTNLYSDSLGQSHVLRDVVQLLRHACKEIFVRHTVWSRCLSSSSALGWKTWFQLIEQCEAKPRDRHNKVYHQIELQTVGLIAELCEEEVIAKAFCTHSRTPLPHFILELAIKQAFPGIAHEMLRILVVIAEYAAKWADPLISLTSMFGNRSKVFQITCLVGENSSNNLLLRFLWLWEQNSSAPLGDRIFSNKTHLFDSYSAEILCSLQSKTIDRTIYLGFVALLLRKLTKTVHLANGGHVSATMISGYVCRSLSHFHASMKLEDFHEAPKTWCSYFYWYKEQKYGLYAQNWRLMELLAQTLSMPSLRTLSSHKSFKHVWDFGIDLSIQAIESAEICYLNATTLQVIYASLRILAHTKSNPYSFMRQLLFEKIKLLASYPDRFLVLTILKSLSSFMSTSFTLVLWLTKKNVDVVQWLIDILNSNMDTEIEGVTLKVLNTLLSHAYRFAAVALAMDIPFLCIKRSMQEPHVNSHLWLCTLGHTARVCGLANVLSKIDSELHGEFMTFLISTKATQIYDTNEKWSMWLATTSEFVGTSHFQEQLAVYWTQSGSQYVASLMQHLYMSPLIQVRQTLALSVLKVLVSAPDNCVLPSIVNMEPEMKALVNHALHFRSATKVNLFALDMLHTLLQVIKFDMSASVLFATLLDAYSQFEMQQPAHLPIWFELLASILMVRRHQRHPQKPSLLDVLPMVNWGYVIHAVVKGLESSQLWHHQSAMYLLNALFAYSHESTVHFTEITDIHPLKTGLQAILDKFSRDTGSRCLLETNCRNFSPSLHSIVPCVPPDAAFYVCDHPNVWSLTVQFLQAESFWTARHCVGLIRYCHADYVASIFAVDAKPVNQTNGNDRKQSRRMTSTRAQLEASTKDMELSVRESQIRRKSNVVAQPLNRLHSKSTTKLVPIAVDKQTLRHCFFQDSRVMYAIAVQCLQELDSDTKAMNVHLVTETTSNIEWGCRFVPYSLVNSDVIPTDACHSMLLLLYHVFIHSSDGTNAAILSNLPFMQSLLRLASSVDFLPLRKLAIASLWKILTGSSPSQLEQFIDRLPQSHSRLLERLYDNITLEKPVIGAPLAPKDEWQDLLLCSCGLLNELALNAPTAAWIASNRYITDTLRVLQTDRPSRIPSANIVFLTMIERMIASGLTTLYVDNATLMLHCLHCLDLDNTEGLRFQAMYVLYLVCQVESGLTELEKLMFPTVAAMGRAPHRVANALVGDTSPNQALHALVHLYALTDGMKCNQPRPQRAAMFLVCQLSAKPHQATALRMCRQSPTSLVNLVTHVLAATIGTTHRNRVEFRGRIDDTDDEAQYNLITGRLALICLERLDVRGDVFQDDACGNKVIVQLFASLGWTNLEICHVASTLLCGIFRHASTADFVERDQDDAEDDQDGGDNDVDMALPTSHPRRNPLTRMKCFRHKVACQIPSYVRLMADWVHWFRREHSTTHVDVLHRVLELLSTSLHLFFQIIYFPIDYSSRTHHDILLDNVFSLALRRPDYLGVDAWLPLQIEALSVLSHLCNHIEYTCNRFEHAPAIQLLFHCIQDSTGKRQLMASHVLQAITKHHLVKECMFANELFEFIPWLNQPPYTPILEPLLHAVKHLVVKSGSNAAAPASQLYNPVKIATLLLKDGPCFLQRNPTATSFRRMHLDMAVKNLSDLDTPLDMNPTYVAAINLNDTATTNLERRFFLPNSMQVRQTWLAPIAITHLTITISRESETVLILQHACGLGQPTTACGIDATFEVDLKMTDIHETDLQSLTGPMGEVLKSCIQQGMSSELALLSELIGELAKHDEVFCDPELNLWCFVAYMLQNGRASGDTSRGMQCLQAIAASANAQHRQFRTFVGHIFFLIQLMDIYGLSTSTGRRRSDEKAHYANHHCMRHKGATTFLLTIADMVANYGSVSFAEKCMRLLLLEHRGVVMYLCGQHRGFEHTCSGYLCVQWHLARVLPSHVVLLSKACFVDMNVKHFMMCTHASDDSIEHAIKLILLLVSNSIASRQFVLNNGLTFLGRLSQILVTNNAAKGLRHIAPMLRQLIVVGSFLTENVLSQPSIPHEIEDAFFPAEVSKDVMPFFEILMLPLLPVDGSFVWTDSALLASKVLSFILEKCASTRTVLEQHLLRMAFRLKQPRIGLFRSAIETCLDFTSWDQAQAVDVIQRVYFVAIRKGIKLGMLSAECTELLPQHSKNDQEASHRSRRSVFSNAPLNFDANAHRSTHESLNPYRDQLLYCFNFTEQHREGRLRDILVRSRKKGIGEMLEAVNNSARVFMLVHNVLEMFFETYVGIVSRCRIEYADTKIKKIRVFCKQVESIATLVASSLHLLDSSYFGLLFAQLHDIRIPKIEGDNQMEWRNVIRSNMKKVLFILKRMVDKKKLKPFLDEQAFVEADATLGAIRLEFAVNGRRRLGHACLDSASVADFLCEAAEIDGLKAFAELIASTKYVFSRSMRRDDNTLYTLEDFMMHAAPALGLRKAVLLLLTSVTTHIVSFLGLPWRGATFVYRSLVFKAQEVESKTETRLSSEAMTTRGHPRCVDSTLVGNAPFRALERGIVSGYPIASILYCPKHEYASNVSNTWKTLRQHGLTQGSQSTFTALLRPNFVEDFCRGLRPKVQELVIEHLLRPESVHHDEWLEQQLNPKEIQSIGLNIESFLARQEMDVELYHVERSTQLVHVWQFVVAPVYRTRLMHAQFLLSDLRASDSYSAALRQWQNMEKGHMSVTAVTKLNPIMKMKATKRLMDHQLTSRVSRWSFLPWRRNALAANVDMGDMKAINSDDIRKKPMGSIFMTYILPVCDRQLEDPLSEKMAWEHLIEEINSNAFPAWVFFIEDPKCPYILRVATKIFRSMLRGVLYVTFWRLEEFNLDLQDTSWPKDSEVIHISKTTRTYLANDIIESIVIYKHFRKAMSELFRVWMLESGSLGLSLWQHWGYFIGGCIFPSVVLFVYLPSAKYASDLNSSDVNYRMKWFMGGFFSAIFALVMWSIVLLVQKTELMVQERQEVRFFPIRRHYSNYLALFGLVSELVQRNSIPFSAGVKWAAGYKLPALINSFGGIGITNFDFIKVVSVNMAFVKCFITFGILAAYLIILKCANKFHKTYPALNTRITKDLPPLVSGLLYVGIVNSFASLLFCTTCDQYAEQEQACLKQRGGSNEPFLFSYPDLPITCWSEAHMPLAYVGLLGLTFIIPVGILGAGMSQVLFPLESLDIKFSPIIELTSQLAKTISTISGLFFTFNTMYSISIGLFLNLVLWSLTIVNTTSSIWYIGTVKSVIYIMSVWTSLCGLANVLVGQPTSEPIYYLNFGWFVICCLASVVLGIRLRIRNIREERARRERMRDYQLLNNDSEMSRLTDMEEDMLRRAAKPLTTEQLEATAPRGFIKAAKAKAEKLESNSLPPHLEDFMRLAKKSAENPTCSEFMFIRRAKRLGRRIAAFDESERLLKEHRQTSNHKAA